MYFIVCLIPQLWLAIGVPTCSVQKNRGLGPPAAPEFWVPRVPAGSPPRLVAQASSQPQLHIEEEADASVECHSSKPWVRGEETGHLLLAQSFFVTPGFGKKLPRCHCDADRGEVGWGRGYKGGPPPPRVRARGPAHI